MIIRSYGAFRDIPESPREFILSMRPQDPGETDGLMQGADGVMKVRDFSGRWGAARSLYGEAVNLMGDPAASRAVALEAGLSQGVKDALVRARDYFPWKAAFNRSEMQQKGLTAALQSLDAALDAYLGQVAPALDAAKAAIAAREAERARAATATQQAAAEEQVARARAAQAQTATLEVTRASASTQAAQLQVKEATAREQAERVIKRVTAPKLFGVPIAVIAPIGLAGAVALFLTLRKKR